MLSPGEKVGGKFPPFLIKSNRGCGFTTARSFVPVAGVGEVAFLTMKMRVDYRAIRIGNTGAEIVGIVPAPGPGQPERT